MAAPSFSEICDRLDIPEALRKHVSAGAAVRGKLAVARGILPAPPRTLLSMQYVLLGDPDESVRAEAEKSIVEMPSGRLAGLLDQSTHPKILEFIVYRRTADVDLMERAVLLRQINDKTICYLAEHTTSDHVAEIIGQNQERLLITPQVLRFLKRNPRTPAALIDRCVSFLRLHGIGHDDEFEAEQQRAEALRRAAEAAEIAAVEEAVSREQANKAPGSIEPEPSVGDAPPLAARSMPSVGEDGFVKGPLPSDFVPGEVYVPAAPATPYQPPPGLLNPLADLLSHWGIELRPDFVAPPYPVQGGPMPVGTDVAGPPLMPSTVLLDGLKEAPDLSSATELGGAGLADSVDLSGLSSLGNSDFAYGFDEEQDSFEGFLTGDSKDDEGAELSIANAIAAMSVGDKIKLAYKGNKTVRELLIRDTNKLVSCAVVKSGRITDNEVMSIATNRAIHEDVIREMARVKEYLRKYPVKVALAGNPKTPIPVVMRMLGSLHVKDLKKLAANRNVSSAVFTAANKLFKTKKAQRGG